jgi:hypothetical protein
MRLSRRPDPALLALFDRAGQNVERVGLLLQEMLSVSRRVDACETVANVLEGISLKRDAGR